MLSFLLLVLALVQGNKGFDCECSSDCLKKYGETIKETPHQFEDVELLIEACRRGCLLYKAMYHSPGFRMVEAEKKDELAKARCREKCQLQPFRGKEFGACETGCEDATVKPVVKMPRVMTLTVLMDEDALSQLERKDIGHPITDPGLASQISDLTANDVKSKTPSLYVTELPSGSGNRPWFHHCGGSWIYESALMGSMLSIVIFLTLGILALNGFFGIKHTCGEVHRITVRGKERPVHVSA